MAGKLTTPEEVKIVALIARGDTAAQISTWLHENMGRTVTAATITQVKRRNMDNIAMLRKKLMIIEERNALSIKQKANRIIDKKLDNAEVDEEARRQLNEQFTNGEITFKDWEEGMRRIRNITIGELVNVSKEMHVQSIDEGDQAKPDTSKTLQALARALESGDSMILSQLIFNKGGDNDPIPDATPEHVEADAVSPEERPETQDSPQG